MSKSKLFQSYRNNLISLYLIDISQNECCIDPISYHFDKRPLVWLFGIYLNIWYDTALQHDCTICHITKQIVWLYVTYGSYPQEQLWSGDNVIGHQNQMESWKSNDFVFSLKLADIWYWTVFVFLNNCMLDVNYSMHFLPVDHSTRK